MKARNTLYCQIRRAVTFSLLIPIIGISFALFFMFLYSLSTRDNGTLLEELKHHKVYIEEWLDSRVKEIVFLANIEGAHLFEDLERLNPTEKEVTAFAQEWIGKFAESFPMFDGIYIINAAGDKIVAKDNIYQVSSADRPYFKEAKNGKSLITDVFKGRITGKLVIGITSPMFNKNKEFLGVVLGTVSAERIANIVRSLHFKGEDSAFLVTKNGEIITAPASKIDLADSTVVPLPKESDNNTLLPKPYKNFMNQWVIGVVVPLYSDKWLLVREQTLFYSFKAEFAYWLIFICVTLLAVVTLSFFLYRFARNISRPVERLSILSRELQAGKEETKNNVDGGNGNFNFQDLKAEPDSNSFAAEIVTEVAISVGGTTSAKSGEGVGGELSGLSTMGYVEKNILFDKNIPFEIKELYKNFYAMAKRITDQVLELKRISYTDQLTGLYNRRFLAIEVRKLVDIALRGKNPCACMMLDIDHFKKINDTWGHDAGDIVLKSLAQKLQELVRGSDVVLRLGGEEFAIILPNAPEDECFKLAERIRVSVEDMVMYFQDIKIKVTISIGITGLYSDMATAKIALDDALTRADSALYVAKNNGRNQVIIWQAEV